MALTCPKCLKPITSGWVKAVNGKEVLVTACQCPEKRGAPRLTRVVKPKINAIMRDEKSGKKYGMAYGGSKVDLSETPYSNPSDHFAYGFAGKLPKEKTVIT